MLILQIQERFQQGHSIRNIAIHLQLSRATVKKYAEGNPNQLCLRGSYTTRERRHDIRQYQEFLIQCIQARMNGTQTYQALQKSHGYAGSRATFSKYFRDFIQERGLELAQKQAGSESKQRVVSRKDVFQYLWMGEDLDADSKRELSLKCPLIPALRKCILEFREIFLFQSIPRLHLFIAQYQNGPFKAIASLARGFQRDLSAIEFAVSSPLSNGFVEGFNHKLKLIKRTMYGRCRLKLLEAKLFLDCTMHG